MGTKTQYERERERKKERWKDSVGQEIISVSELSPEKQTDAWKASTLKNEWVALFPDFDAMRMFAQERVEGDYLKQKLISAADKAEDDYFSGKVTVDKAKQMLDSLK